MTRDIRLVSLNLLIGVCVCVTAVGCGLAEEYHEPMEDRGRVSAAILNGSEDTTHQAVVAYSTGASRHSATIVGRAGSYGYALTAGHVVAGSLGTVRQGNSVASGEYDRAYPVVEVTVHPCFPTDPNYDVAVLSFSGASAATPVIPALSPAEDSLAAGGRLEHVGYGRTEGGITSRRHSTSNVLSAVDRIQLTYDVSTTGPAPGDSGGPGIVTTTAGERVASVISSVDGTSSTGYDVRVSALYEDFVMAVIDNTPISWDDGNPCTDNTIGVGGCATTFNTDPCDDSTACTENDTCGDGSCQPGTPNDALCTEAGPCEQATCDPDAGCIYVPLSDGAPCVGFDPSTHACLDGTCQILPGTDAGMDGGSELDAAVSDAGKDGGRDAAVDASIRHDAGLRGDGSVGGDGSLAAGEGGGCGCRTNEPGQGKAAYLVLMALAGSLLLGRRPRPRVRGTSGAVSGASPTPRTRASGR